MLLGVLCVAPLRAQDVAPATDLRTRLDLLEAETQALRDEVADQQNRIEQLESENAHLSTLSANHWAIDRDEFITRKEFQAGLKGLAWKKGPFTITPYGQIIASAIYETSRCVSGDYILFVYPPELEPEDAFYVDAKSTRLGMDVVGPPLAWVPDAKLGGVVEVDFQGEYTYSNKPGLLFRKAYVDLKNEEFLVLAGQTWEILSPLYPGMLNYVPGSAVGNLGYRRSMFRYDRYLAVSDRLLFTFQGSLNSDVVFDFVSDASTDGSPAGWPILEFRSAVTLGERKGKDARPTTLGFSGHVGEIYYDYATGGDNCSHKTWSFNLDFRWPWTQRMGFQCEFFTGENLSSFMGGILQGIDPITHEEIRSTGGWFDVWYDWTPQLHSHTGYSIDDPNNEDVHRGRTYNECYFGNVVYDWSDALSTGLEVSVWQTNWVGYSAGKDERFEFQVKYRF